MMGKSKKRQLDSTPTHENTCPPEDRPIEDGFVMVKKQRINILIPCLPVTSESILPEPESSQRQIMPMKAINGPSECLVQTDPWMNSASDREKSKSLATESVIPLEGRISPRQPVTTCQEKTKLIALTRPRIAQVHPVNCKKLGVDSTHKVSRSSIRFFNGGVLLHQRMRASNLESKIEKAGGLSCWLTSLGLDQFIKIFKGRSVNKFQLVNLTMRKLKEMGADAVGPRRKLMHAINCLCQPYCFQHLRVSCNINRKYMLNNK